MTPVVGTALEGLGVGLFALGLALVVGSLLGFAAAVGVGLIVVGLYCALAANVLGSGASANESGTRASNTSDTAQRR